MDKVVKISLYLSRSSEDCSAGHWHIAYSTDDFMLEVLHYMYIFNRRYINIVTEY